MHRAQEQVREFHKLIDAPTSPAEPKMRNSELRARLILEEAVETVMALTDTNIAASMLQAEYDKIRNGKTVRRNLVEAIDGLCDTIVVCYGTAEDIGIDLEPFFDEVHRSNMAKVNGGKDADGKWQKPPGWRAPDITGLLARVT